MKLTIFFILNFYLLTNTFSQNKLSVLAELSDQLNETSALITFNDLFWTINDSGGEPIIYGFNKKGKLDREVEIPGAKNKDWEALAINDTHIFIGDFGNNFGSRKDLKIYAVKLEYLDSSRGEVDYVIQFNYPEQISWTPNIGKTEFDCEAMVATNDEIHLFTKDWKNKIGAHYVLRNQAGNQNAAFKNKINAEGLITDVTLVNSNLYFIGYLDYIPILWIYHLDSTKHYKQKINMPKNYKYQVEGIAYLNDTLFITSEKSAIEQSLMYYLIQD